MIASNLSLIISNHSTSIFQPMDSMKPALKTLPFQPKSLIRSLPSSKCMKLGDVHPSCLHLNIESAPLVHSKPTKAPNKDDTQQKERHSSQSDNSNKTKPPPPPRIEHEDPPNDNGNTVYKNPSSAVKSRERDWERLRRHFAWLPKLVVQKTFDCTTQLARIPMSVHLQRHYKSPFPALNVNRRDEPVATDTVYADIPDIEHGH